MCLLIFAVAGQHIARRRARNVRSRHTAGALLKVPRLKETRGVQSGHTTGKLGFRPAGQRGSPFNVAHGDQMNKHLPAHPVLLLKPVPGRCRSALTSRQFGPMSTSLVYREMGNFP